MLGNLIILAVDVYKPFTALQSVHVDSCACPTSNMHILSSVNTAVISLIIYALILILYCFVVYHKHYCLYVCLLMSVLWNVVFIGSFLRLLFSYPFLILSSMLIIEMLSVHYAALV